MTLQSEKVTPSPPMEDVRDGGSRNTKCRGDLHLSSATATISNGKNIGFAQLRVVMRLAERPSPTSNAVSHIFRLGPRAKMCWLNAYGAIARVQNAGPFFCNGVACIEDAVRNDMSAGGDSSKIEAPISAFVKRSGPIPTSLRRRVRVGRVARKEPGEHLCLTEVIRPLKASASAGIAKPLPSLVMRSTQGAGLYGLPAVGDRTHLFIVARIPS